MLRHRERQVAELQGQLEETKMEAEALRSYLAQRNAKLEELEEEVSMLMEKNNAKQEVRADESYTGLVSGPEWSCDLSLTGDHKTVQPDDHLDG